jgi:GT2 family glycosyltransferase
VSRPPVSVVMPFAGDPAAAREAVGALTALTTEPGDELIVADNSGTVPSADGVTVIRATAEQSPAHSRNLGAEHAANDWILFLDADCRAPAGLLDAYFADSIADDVGALAGEVIPAADGATLAARYGAARSFLSQRAHLQHPFRPRAVAANLLVRRTAFTAIGGFYEGVRAAEDTDFSWRLQAAGWRLELRHAAAVEHRYRTSLDDLRRQWRGYAAGRAWLARRYDGFTPQPAARRGVKRVLSRRTGRTSSQTAPGKFGSGRLESIQGDEPNSLKGIRPSDLGETIRSGPDSPGTPGEARPQYIALDLLLAAEELAGFALSNRPHTTRRGPAKVVLIADRFPARGDPRAELAASLDGARVEASARPEVPDLALYRRLAVDYREDDGVAARLLSLLVLVLDHPVRVALDLLGRRPGAPPLRTLAPAVRRLERDQAARVQALGGADTQAVARRIARLTGRA